MAFIAFKLLDVMTRTEKEQKNVFFFFFFFVATDFVALYFEINLN